MAMKVLLLLAAVGVVAALPDFVPVCARDDPDIDSCIVKAIAEMRPRLLEGIPELDIPALKEFKINELSMTPPSFSYRIFARNIVARGGEDFRVFRFKSDLERNTFYLGVEFPVLDFDAQYSMNIPTPIMRINGAGDVRGNVTNVRCNAVLEGKVVKRDGNSFFNFKTLDLDIKISDYKVHFTGLFGDNKILQDIAISMINERSKEYAWGVEPFAERAASGLVLMWANAIAKHLPLEDIFPASTPQL